MTYDEATDVLHKFVTQISEFFDEVELIVTSTDAETGQKQIIHGGCGDWIIKKGMVDTVHDEMRAEIMLEKMGGPYEYEYDDEDDDDDGESWKVKTK